MYGLFGIDDNSLTGDRFQIHINLGLSLFFAQIGVLLGDALKQWPVSTMD